MMISLIVAMDINRVIGNKGKIPWHLCADLRRFQKITTGHPIIMGRKTHESIGRCLPNRLNIVVTRQPAYQAYEDATVVNTLNDALHIAANNDSEIFVIGGGELYNLALPYAKRVYITQILHSFKGDTTFPELNDSEWMLTKEECIKQDHEPRYSYVFLQYDRKI